MCSYRRLDIPVCLELIWFGQRLLLYVITIACVLMWNHSNSIFPSFFLFLFFLGALGQQVSSRLQIHPSGINFRPLIWCLLWAPLQHVTRHACLSVFFLKSIVFGDVLRTRRVWYQCYASLVVWQVVSLKKLRKSSHSKGSLSWQ